MIRSVRHRGLQRLRERNDASRLPSTYVSKIRVLCDLLHAAEGPRDLDGVARLDPLRGDRAGSWALHVSANWRLVFRFEDGHVYDLDLVDYH